MRYTLRRREQKIEENLAAVKATIKRANEKEEAYYGNSNYYVELVATNEIKLEKLKAFHTELEDAVDFGDDIEIYNWAAFNKAIEEADIDDCLYDGQFVKIHYVARFPYEGKNIAWVMKYQDVMK